MNEQLESGFKESEIGPIPEDWRVIAIKDVATLITKGTTPTTAEGGFSSEGVRFLKVENLSNDGKILGDKFTFIRDSTNLLLKRSVLKESDILYSIAGTIGRVAIVSKEILPANTNQALAIIRPDLSKIDLDFLKYYLLSPDVRTNLVSKVVHGVQANLSLSELGSCPLTYPKREEQTRIASILSSLDDKIELNRQMNATLEKIASALFKRWFVDFEFPDENGRPYKSSGGKMVESEMGEIPEGWASEPLDEVANFLNGLALQKYPADPRAGSLPVIKIRELKNGITESTERASKNIPVDYIIKDGDVLFSWSGSLEVDIWTGGIGALNQHLFKVTSTKYPKWFYLQWVKFFLPSFQTIAASKAVTMGHIKREHLSECLAKIPCATTLNLMGNCFSPILEQIITSSIEITRLSELRDSILPRLMNGRIRA